MCNRDAVSSELRHCCATWFSEPEASAAACIPGSEVAFLRLEQGDTIIDSFF
jgi:hypothetical protein